MHRSKNIIMIQRTLCHVVKIKTHQMCKQSTPNIIYESCEGMDKNIENLLHLFACGAKGETPIIKDDLDLQEIYTLSVQQNIWPVVFLSIKSLYISGKIQIDDTQYKAMNNSVLLSIMKNIQKLQNIHVLLNYFNDNDIEHCVLKGESLSHLYAYPDSRISGDVDILVSPEQEELAMDILRKNGVDVEPRFELSHHAHCNSKKHGIIELHTTLYSDLYDDIVFHSKINKTEKPIKLQLSDVSIINTLGITDGLNFTFAHLIRHFIESGTGIRQIMDLLLYIKTYKDDIDIFSFRKIIKELKFDKFMDNILGLGVSYLNFEPSDFYEFSFDQQTVDALVDDTIKGGNFGRNEDERKEFAYIYMEQRFKTFRTDNYNRYMTDWRKNAAKKVISFDKKNIQKKYYYAKEHNILLPIAYVHHAFYIFFGFLKRINRLNKFISYKNPKKTNSIIKRRMELAKQLDII